MSKHLDIYSEDDDGPFGALDPDDYVIETYTTVNEFGEKVKKAVIRFIPRMKIAAREMRTEHARFHKHRLKQQIADEARWGRDDLKSRGFVCLARQEHPSGKVIFIMGLPETSERDLRHARHAVVNGIALLHPATRLMTQAACVAQQAWDGPRALPERIEETTEQSLSELLDEVHRLINDDRRHKSEETAD
jgi:hypothetical protein